MCFIAIDSVMELLSKFGDSYRTTYCFFSVSFLYLCTRDILALEAGVNKEKSSKGSYDR